MLAPEECAKVMEILRSHTYREAAPLVTEAVGFACSVDVLCRFFSWQGAREDMEISTDVLKQVISFASKHRACWPDEKIRETVAGFFTMHALANRDLKGFANVTRLYVQTEQCRIKRKKLALDKLKFKESLRDKAKAGADALAKELSKTPEAMNLYEQVKALLEKRKTD
jgi:DNA-binding sugar fermentation-stimulating protein